MKQLDRPVIVVGAGVIGLSCALKLCEEGHKVIVIARDFPDDPLTTDYTSLWAGAHFRPFPSTNNDDVRQSGYTRETLKYFKELVKTHPECAVRFVEGVEWLEDPSDLYKTLAPGMSDGIDGFELLQSKDLPSGTIFGCRYETWVLNPPLYLDFIYRRLKFYYHVDFIHEKVNSLEQVHARFSPSFIINATGVGLLYNGQYDPQSFPIRGQTLLVRAPKYHPYLNKTVTHQDRNGLWTFVIPRPFDGGVIIGGTKQLNDTQATPRAQDAFDLVSRAKRLFPELMVDKDGVKQYDIMRINVGFRPARNPGSRVEREQVEPGKYIIHAYGFGGMGFEVSYGVAKEVASLVSTSILSSKL